MQITCSKCQHKQGFQVEITDYQGYICPNCHAYFRGTDPSSWTFQKNFNALKNPQWPTLGEFIQINEVKYQIITKIHRISSSGMSNEYVGLSTDDQEVYLSDGADYACILEQINPSRLTSIDAEQIKFAGRNFEFEEKVEADFVYGEGFIFENPDIRSNSSTYAETMDDNNFFSVEEFDGELEYYYGSYWDQHKYNSLFNSYLIHKEQTKIIGNKFLMLLIPFIILPGLLFYLLNASQFVKQTISFNETFSSKSVQNSFISTPFELKGEKRKLLKYEGFSVPNVNNLALQISLVNEKTNFTRVLRRIEHQTNAKNQANALSIDFCRVSPGKYHLVFETSGAVVLEKDLKLEEQIQLKYGGVSYMPLVIAYFLVIVLTIVFGVSLSKVETARKLTENGSVSSIALLKHQGFAFYFLLLGLLVYGLQYYNENITTCENSINVDNQVDHTQTGSTRVYRRMPIFTGSHK